MPQPSWKLGSYIKEVSLNARTGFMSSLIHTVLVTVGNMALSVWDFLLSDTAFFCFPPSSWSVTSALVIPTTWIKMKHSLQKLMSLLEITGYISSKGRGKSIRWSEPILDLCSARSELSTNFDLKKHQIPQRVRAAPQGWLWQLDWSLRFTVSYHVLEKPETGGNNRLKSLS